MAKLKYAVVGDEFIETKFHDTELAAIEEFNQISDEPYNEKNWQVKSFASEEIAEITAYSEAHPQ
jgi:hypothetical protein